MKNKKLWLFEIILFILFLGGSFFIFKSLDKKNNNDDIKQSEVEKEESKKIATPLLYEVTKKCSENKIYLFGSIHVADDRAYPMQDKIIEAYKNSDYLAVEFDLIKYEKDLQEQIDTMTLLAYSDGSTIKEHMYEDSYNLMVNYLKENKMYNSLYDYYKPALFYSLISNVQAIKSELDAEKGKDMLDAEYDRIVAQAQDYRAIFGKEET